jgi:hypothetical protein
VTHWIVFSRLGKPHIGSPNAFSFNTAVSGAGSATSVSAGHSPRCPAASASVRGHARRPAELVAARSTLTGEHLAAYVGT